MESGIGADYPVYVADIHKMADYSAYSSISMAKIPLLRLPILSFCRNPKIFWKLDGLHHIMMCKNDSVSVSATEKPAVWECRNSFRTNKAQ